MVSTMKLKRLRRCAAHGCREYFTATLSNQLYHSRTCANREKQRRLRERAKLRAK